MQFSFSRFKGKSVPWADVCRWAVLILLIVSILWRGGKSLDMTWLLTGVACMVTIISHTLHRKTGNSDIPLLLWGAVIGFMVLTGISYLYSSTANYGIDEVLRTGSLGLIFLWIIREGSNGGGEYHLKILRYFCITVVAACGIGILVYVFQPVDRFVGTFFDYRFHTDYWPNAWAEFLLLAWPIVLYWTLRDFEFNSKEARSRIELLVRAVVLGLVFGCLMLAYSRGAVLVFFLQLLLWAGIIYKKVKRDFPLNTVVPIAVMLMAVATLSFLSFNTLRGQYYEVQEVGEKVTLTASEGTSSVSERFQFWRQSLSLAKQKPILGWGPYSFRFIQPQLQRHVLATSDHPHNVLLKILMERGALAMLLFGLVIGLVLIRTARTLLSDKVEAGTTMFSLRMLIFLGLFGVLIHNMIDFNLQFVGIALPMWLLLGILMTNLQVKDLTLVSRDVARYVEITIASALLLFAVFEGVYLVISSIGRNAEARHEYEAALLWYGRADREFFKRDLHLSEAKLLFENSMFDEAQVRIDAYLTENQEDYRVWKRQGDIALMRGEKQRALEAYNTAFERGKFNDLGVLHGMIEGYLALGKEEEIEAKRPMIDGLLTSFESAIAVNTHFIDLSPNVEEFIAICNRLAILFPEDAPRYQVMAAKADHHAQIERDRLKSRPPGFLW